MSEQSKTDINAYKFFTIDTQVVHSNGEQLYRGHLKQMTQVKSRTLTFVMSEVIAKEIRKARVEKVGETTNSFNKILRRHDQTPFDTKQTKALLDEISKLILSAEDFVSNEFSDWVKETHCKIIDTKNVDTSVLLDLYFKERAPFGPGNKKHEFPDALALLSLEEWAKVQESRILAISKDKDWIKFAENSAYIDVAPSLSPIISHLNDVEPIQREVDEVIHAIYEAPECDLALEMHQNIQWALEQVTPQFEVQTDTFFELDDEVLELLSYSFAPLPSGQMYSVIKVEEDNRVIEARLSIQVNVSATLNHLHHDKEEKSYHVLNTTNLEETEDYEVSALIYYSNAPDYAAKMRVIALDTVELFEFSAFYNFGYVDVF